MFSAFLNIFKVKDLRTRILFTAMIIVLVRFACNIPCPGVNAAALSEYMAKMAADNAGNAAGGLLGMLSIFSGGAIEKFAIGALGIMPYITASIVMQLLTPVLPALEKMQREGESGHQRINQYTRYLTILVCILNGMMVAMTIVNPARFQMPAPEKILYVGNVHLFVSMSIIVLTATTMLFMWLGEQVTERGIGNGVSIIITINIIARMPDAVLELGRMTRAGEMINGASFKPVHLLLLLLLFVIVTAATIVLSQGYRRVPIQMVRKTIGSQLTGGSTYMPLKVNFAGVMPIIFAGAIMMALGLLFGALHWGRAAHFIQHGTWSYLFSEGLLIMIFSYFWVANQFNPIQIADNLKKEGAYIPGISPGAPTSEFLDRTMTQVTFGGAIFLVVIALFPMFLFSMFKLPFLVTRFFGGTSLLIMVGVTLDTMRQLESHLTMRHYEGFLKSGRIRGRGGR